MPRDALFAVRIVTSPDEGALADGRGLAGFGEAVGEGDAVGAGDAAVEGDAADADWLLGGAEGADADEVAPVQAETTPTMASGRRSRAIDARFVQVRFTMELLRLVALPTRMGPGAD